MLKLTDIAKSYRTTEVETRALDGVSLEIGGGEFVAIMGPSGCGKSTLLNILGLIDTPTEGSFLFLNEEIAGYAEDKLTRLRRAHIGFVFQSFNLIGSLTAEQNVALPLRLAGRRTKRSQAASRSATSRGPAPTSRSTPRPSRRHTTASARAAAPGS